MTLTRSTVAQGMQFPAVETVDVMAKKGVFVNKIKRVQ